MMHVDKLNSRGAKKYPATARTVENALIGIVGEWEAEVMVATDKDEAFYTRMSDSQKDLSKVSWKDGLKVVCAMLYGDGKKEREVIYEVMVTFQTPEGEDHVREVDLILAVLRAWVREEAFPNARMAVNVQRLLPVSDIHGYLEKINFPAFIKNQG